MCIAAEDVTYPYERKDGPVKRREVLSFLACAAAALPLTAVAQSPGPPVVGFLNGGSAEPYEPMVVAFRGGLKEAGVIEDRNVVVIYRWADGNYDRLPDLAGDLV